MSLANLALEKTFAVFFVLNVTYISTCIKIIIFGNVSIHLGEFSLLGALGLIRGVGVRGIPLPSVVIISFQTNWR